jgi:hypothetical protein
MKAFFDRLMLLMFVTAHFLILCFVIGIVIGIVITVIMAIVEPFPQLTNDVLLNFVGFIFGTPVGAVVASSLVHLMHWLLTGKSRPAIVQGKLERFLNKSK